MNYGNGSLLSATSRRRTASTTKNCPLAILAGDTVTVTGPAASCQKGFIRASNALPTQVGLLTTASPIETKFKETR